MKKCKDIMTKDLVTVSSESTVADVARLMKTEDIGPVLIVDNEQNNTLVGIVTDRDIVVKVIADGQDVNTTRVGDVMSKKLVTCHADDDVEVAMKAMAQFQLRRIPVVEENMRLVGIISQADLATRVDAPEKTGEVVKEISEETT
ncbi:MAG TPA: CBS domain-containing protein [Anaerolineales bacterium]|jgi:CBS domain-containing protein|nr:CBS domain-containing protein [Anaerolineales bacterium]